VDSRPLLVRKGYYLRNHVKDWSWKCRRCRSFGIAPSLLLPDTYAAAIDHLRTKHPEAVA
jgi:hypothetical protein